MAIVYVDPLNGTDNGDAGRGETDGTSAYASISYAIANYGSFSTTESNTIYLADTSPDVLSASLNTNSISGESYYLIIEGYHYDGSNGGTAGSNLVSLPFGSSVSGGVIDGNDAVAYVSQINTYYCIFRNLEMRSFTSIPIYFLGTSGAAINCYIHDHLGLGTIYYGRVYSSKLEGGTTYVVYDPAEILNCEIYGNGSTTEGIRIVTDGKTVGNCLIYNISNHCIVNGRDLNLFYGNTLDGTGSTLADSSGIRSSSSAQRITIIDNILSNFDTASGAGLRFDSGAKIADCRNNAFYNNTTDSVLNGAGRVQDSLIETSDPYVDSASYNFKLKDGAFSKNAAIFT
jgi:hypothetical protein